MAGLNGENKRYILVETASEDDFDTLVSTRLIGLYDNADSARACMQELYEEALDEMRTGNDPDDADDEERVYISNVDARVEDDITNAFKYWKILELPLPNNIS